MEINKLLEQFQKRRAVANAQKVDIETAQAGLGPTAELGDIPVLPEFKEKKPAQIVLDVQGQMFREAAFVIGKFAWDNAGYYDIGYRTQFGVKPAVGLLAVYVKQDTDYSWETKEAEKIRKFLSSEEMKKFYDENPDYKKNKKKNLLDTRLKLLNIELLSGGD